MVVVSLKWALPCAADEQSLDEGQCLKRFRNHCFPPQAERTKPSSVDPLINKYFLRITPQQCFFML